MRITTNMIYNRNISALTSTNERLSTAYEQLMTGDRFKTAGEDPSAMGQKLELTNEIELFKQYTVNGGLLENSLAHEETIVSALNEAMMSATTLIQKSNNASMGQGEREAIANELTGLQKQMFDLINTKNSQGEYIFGGNKNMTPPYARDAAGVYQFQGDTGQRLLQVSPTVMIEASDNGMDLFESIATRRTASATTANMTVMVKEQSQYDSFFANSYKPSGTNLFTVTTTTGTPDKYTITDPGGAVLQTGDYKSGESVAFQGLELTLSVPAGGAAQTFKLDAPKNDNILNGLEQYITDLKDPNLTSSQFRDSVADVTSHIQNARLRMDRAQGDIGARMNGLSQAMASNSALDSFNQDVRAKVSEVDLYRVISDLSKEDAALTASQLSFSKISKLTLFDYIR
ncbi:flagellar hook-associated protein FlgL [Aeromonas diversa]|uniref:flagellar hook-associated protein FlgL n=1 Tax=Aeromonas diversa TaxID=502790 RepID=UPI0039A36D91